ncbi:SDR family NAD(P)-dependent oxidoreductase [Sporichthya sp.]|uniref:SDR family NAD(P)-dependent oxidoreductase n=1 Tax=Sporichthya sp. TaxID=65475 RepID=UPI0017A58E3C|nr:SDR family NAD(P)-dependent oxidoreductase [Sporichthya sp.]MBA3741481.1 SDR family oxidoreductase [Sporichthya sp.]
MAVPDLSATPLQDLYSLTGRVAVVTGAGRGVGAGCARRLAEAGASVAVCDIDPTTIETTVKEIESEGGRALGVVMDVSDAAAIQQGVERILAELGQIDILVNNAGIFPPCPFLDENDEHWGRVLGVNLDGVMRCSQSVARHLVARGAPGVIVNISSIEGEKPGTAGAGAYVTSKASVTGLTKALAIELGPLGIRVLAVAPTLVNTPGVQELMPMMEAAGIGNLIEALRVKVPLGRAAVPDDVARAVTFAASDMSMLMTGSTLYVDAGAMTV